MKENSEKKSGNVGRFLRSPSDKKLRKKDIIQVLTSSAADSTTHGIVHVFKRENTCIRMFWLFCFIASAGVCAYMITLSVIDYFEYDTVTKAKRVNQISTDFPTISICNQNPFMTNDSFEYVRSLLVANNIINPVAPELTFDNLSDDALLVFRYFIGANLMDLRNSDTLRKSMGYNLSQMLFSCTYNFIPCSADDFYWFYDIFYGNCYKFNSGKLANGSTHETIKTQRAGAIIGLSIELFLYEPTSVFSLAATTGVHVFIHNKTHEPLFSEGVSVATGANTKIEVQRTFSNELPTPYSDCSDDITVNYPSNLVRYFFNVNSSYTQLKCFLACYQRYLVGECGCFDTSFGHPPSFITNWENIPPCILFNQSLCNANRYSKFFSGDVEAACGHECPRECERITYSLLTSQSEYPSALYSRSLMNNLVIQSKYGFNLSQLSYESLKRNMAKISINYGDLGYQKFEELAKTSLLDLISGIGGTLGLFLGMSFLSFVEIIDAVLQIIFLKTSTKKTNIVVP